MDKVLNSHYPSSKSKVDNFYLGPPKVYELQKFPRNTSSLKVKQLIDSRRSVSIKRADRPENAICTSTWQKAVAIDMRMRRTVKICPNQPGDKETVREKKSTPSVWPLTFLEGTPIGSRHDFMIAAHAITANNRKSQHHVREYWKRL